MAFADLFPHPELFNPLYAIAAIASLLIGVVTVLYQSRTVWPDKAPKLIRGWPMIGSWDFWTRRIDFHRENFLKSDTGHFSFMVGSKPVVAVSGEEGRKVFFESAKLDLTLGYQALFAGAPDRRPKGDDEVEVKNRMHFVKRMTNLVKRDQFLTSLPYLINDTLDRLDTLAKKSPGIFDPFEDIYRIVFQLTMRTVACKEAAEDRQMLDTLLYLFEQVESCATPTLIMYPSLPTYSKLKRVYAGGRIYFIFDKLIKQRQKTGRREDDAMQYMMDLGDSTLDVITFVMSALFAGQLNSGINAAWLLAFLAANPIWRDASFREIERVAAKYDPDTTKPLVQRLASVPLEGWESDFPVAEACLRDSIRLNTNGTTFRKNVSPTPVTIGSQHIPPGAYVTYAVADVHLDPQIYPDPSRWNPGRYITPEGGPAPPSSPQSYHPDGVTLPWVGWGAGRHPCLGMRFAKLEQNIIIAFFMAMFDFELADKEKGVPEIDVNANSAHKPAEKVLLRYWLREGGATAA
ncbi:cytochrome P450 [Myriangium duriaei CBS 260.36]|uniref:Cytochrome P450 n=1 Tax=Myriangium duriaei CBS 260.36 TaxID=1168546 RepID=A0A9P4MSH4_9PEZI|nr:cytochrome P450 [Myriangium duriaei CBS 260.36]